MILFRRRSTRDLLGIQEIREHTVRTAHGERSYYFLTPTNISVLSREGVADRVQSLMEVLKALDRAELICLDGSESYAENRDFVTPFEEDAILTGAANRNRLDLSHEGNVRRTVAADERRRFRRLMPLECERIQGLPGRWTDLPSGFDSARYRALGNSVVVICVDYLM